MVLCNPHPWSPCTNNNSGAAVTVGVCARRRVFVRKISVSWQPNWDSCVQELHTNWPLMWFAYRQIVT